MGDFPREELDFSLGTVSTKDIGKGMPDVRNLGRVPCSKVCLSGVLRRYQSRTQTGETACGSDAAIVESFLSR